MVRGFCGETRCMYVWFQTKWKGKRNAQTYYWSKKSISNSSKPVEFFHFLPHTRFWEMSGSILFFSFAREAVKERELLPRNLQSLKTSLFACGTRNLNLLLPLVRLSECWVKYFWLSISIRPWVSLNISVNLACLLLVSSVAHPKSLIMSVTLAYLS